ncbi:hypothetical protein [Streptomyces sp. NBC_00370]|uniref:hypothetical protein n=1 Tax=Streptomyces sp. NBC_00370 TaxID=2975728 RepID=UPI002E25DB34
MRRWVSHLFRQGGGPSGDRASGGGSRDAAGGPPVEDIDGVLLVRSVDDDSFPIAMLAEVAHAFGAEDDVVTVLVGSGGGGQAGGGQASGGQPGGGQDGGHWSRLAGLLDSLRARGTSRVRLVLSGAGDERPGRPSTARRIADAWELEVFAPDGVVLITPGGTLFVDGGSRPDGAWWRFAPGETPRKLGPRAPAPAWQDAVGRVPQRTTGGCVVEQIPAGVLIRPADAPAPRPDDLCFAIPLDTEHATVLVGAPQAEDVAADEVAAVLTALPAEHRSRARLAPGGRRDLLRLGHAVADLLDGTVEVLTGLPLLADHAPPGAVPRPSLIGFDGEPSWQPYVTSVACLPTDTQGRTPVPRLLGSHPPAWLPGGTEPGTVRLTDRWQATVTRSGLALWARGGPRPPLAGAAVDPETCAIELGFPGQPLDASLLPALSRLLTGLGATARARTTLLVRGRIVGGEGELRRLAAEHGVRGIRYVTAGRPGGPVPSWPAPRRRGPAPGLPASAPAPALPPGAVPPPVVRAPAELPPAAARPPAVSGPVGTGAAPRTEPGRRPVPTNALTSSVPPAGDAAAGGTLVRTSSSAAPPTPGGQPGPVEPESTAVTAPFLPVLPGHVSDAAERAAFREFAGDGWDRHAAAVSRLLSRMPVLRGRELEAVRTDLVAVHAYLTAEKGPLHHRELVDDLRAGEGRLLPYAGCVTSALRTLPSYRGVVLRGGGAADSPEPEPETGALLQDPAPVSGLVLGPALAGGTPVRYAILSATGRKVRRLTEPADTAPDTNDEIVFAPGTGFRVLGSWTPPAGPSVVLLRELPAHATAYMDGTQELSQRDLRARTQLKDALAAGLPGGEGAGWPERCVGPVGHQPPRAAVRPTTHQAEGEQ